MRLTLKPGDVIPKDAIHVVHGMSHLAMNEVMYEVPDPAPRVTARIEIRERDKYGNTFTPTYIDGANIVTAEDLRQARISPDSLYQYHKLENRLRDHGVTDAALGRGKGEQHAD